MTPSLRPPPEGIVASARPPGWAAKAWMAIFDPLKKSHHGQLARGRSLARSGKVRELWFSPGMVGAQVSEGANVHSVRLRVQPFEEDQWDRVLQRLTEKISRIADLLEGDLPENLVSTLRDDGLPLIPAHTQLDGDCDCEDFRLPCCHMAAAHNLVADALDGDPFLLLTLRGLDRDQLLRRVRLAWGDPKPLIPPQAEETTAPPRVSTGWNTSPVALPRAQVTIPASSEPQAGLQALGPPPGGDELVQALAPLYEAGAQAAQDIAYDTAPSTTSARAERWRGFKRGRSAPETLARAAREARRPPIQPDEAMLVRRIVEHLASEGPTSVNQLSDQIGEPRARVASQLEALATMGLLYKIVRARSVKWALG